MWRFVPGPENPSDIATRGLTPSQLSERTDWWNGPSWLIQPSTEWPSNPSLFSQQEPLEERPAKVNVIHNSPKQWDLVYRYSNLNRLLRITAQCQRAVSRFKGVSTFSLSPITTDELEKAKMLWVKLTQRLYFCHELDTLKNGKSLPASNPLLRLTPFVDSDGLLRLGGRLQRSLLPPSA